MVFFTYFVTSSQVSKIQIKTLKFFSSQILLPISFRNNDDHKSEVNIYYTMSVIIRYNWMIRDASSHIALCMI
jgi:hypothetical protein